MTDNWQRFTNKMLFYSGIQLEAWKNNDVPSAGAFREACINSMILTYQSLLAEILVVYQIQVKRLPDMSDAWGLIQQKQEASSELSYIRQLEQKPGWLLSLKKAHEESLSPDGHLPGHRSRELLLRDVDECPLARAVDAEPVLTSLKELVTYSRNYSFEW